MKKKHEMKNEMKKIKWNKKKKAFKTFMKMAILCLQELQEEEEILEESGKKIKFYRNWQFHFITATSNWQISKK